MLNINANIFSSISSEYNPAFAPISLAGRTTLITTGDSITAGQGASTTANRYTNLFATATGLSLTNVGIGGRGVWRMVEETKSIVFTRPQTLITAMTGLNDTRRGGENTKTYKKVEACYNTLVYKAFSITNGVSGSVNVTRANGTFNSYAANTVGGNNTTGAIPGATIATFSSTPGATWSYTGTGMGVKLIASDGVNYPLGSCNIYLDGVLKDTINLTGNYDFISDGEYDNGRGPLAIIYGGLANTSHTLVVEVISGNVPVDAFSVIGTPSEVAALIFAEIPYCLPAGYTGVGVDQGSIITSDKCSNIYRGIANKWRALGYPIAYAKTNAFYDPSTTVDSVHPNDTGHAQINNAFISVII